MGPDAASARIPTPKPCPSHLFSFRQVSRLRDLGNQQAPIPGQPKHAQHTIRTTLLKIKSEVGHFPET
jgi:hypothetical protein